MKLTDKAIAAIELPAGKAQLVVWDSELAGLGVVVGRRVRTFVVEGRVAGKKRRTAIGALGVIRDDGRPWTTTLARLRAKELLGEMAAGRVPGSGRRSARGPTLGDAFEAHLGRMRSRRRAARSIENVEAVRGYVGALLDRPISSITGVDLAELHARIKAETRPRAGANPSNERGAPMANRVIATISACWNSLNRRLEGKLGNWNPAKAVDRDVLQPKRERVPDRALPQWWAGVSKLAPVRRDFHLFCMLTAMRSEAARHVRWEHVDLYENALKVPSPKGGEAKAFRLPLGPAAVAMLRERRLDNAALFRLHGGDAGFAFPSLSRKKPFRVQATASAAERRRNLATGRVELLVPGPHVSRRTYLSVAAEIGISELDRSVLVNHAFGRQSVNQTYIEQSFPHLLDCQVRIESELLRRMGHRQAVLPTAQVAAQASTSARA